MTQTFNIDGRKLTLKDIDGLLRGTLDVQVSDDVKQKIAHCRSFLEKKLADSDVPFYGINTGFGSLCDVKISDEDLDKLQLNLVRSHACGMGDRVPDDIARLILFLKIVNMTWGFSGVRTELVDRMTKIYNDQIVPTIFQLGSLGASGDLAPLAHLGLTIIGEDTNNKMDPFPLKEKEGISILNGTQFSLAYGAQCTIMAEKMLKTFSKVAALSLEAFLCDETPFHPAIQAIRPYDGQIEVSKQIRECRSGSDLTKLPRQSVQDPYSFRCIPQVHGASYDAIMHTKKLLEIELNSVTDNPLIFPDEDLIMSGGNFHAQPVAIALDHLSIALAELGSIAERRIFLMISGQRGLPDFLVKDAGINSGFMIAQYTAASIVSQNKQLTMPASSDSITSCKGKEDHVSMAANAATKCHRVVENVQRLLALELLVSGQALDFRRPHQSSPTVENLHKGLRESVPYFEEDRILHEDIKASESYVAQLLKETPID